MRAIAAGLTVLALGALGSQARAGTTLPPTVTSTPVAAGDVVQFTVALPLRDAAGLDALLAAQQDPKSTSYHHFLTPGQFDTQFGPTSDTIAQAVSSLGAQGLTVTGVTGRLIQVSGPAATVAKALSVNLLNVGLSTGQSVVISTTKPVLPSGVAPGSVTPAFTGLPKMHPQSRKTATIDVNNRYAPNGPYWFTDLKQAYDYPAYNATVNGQRLDGTGVNVAVLMEYDALDSDIAKMFDHEKFSAVSGTPNPTIEHVAPLGAQPFNPNGSTEASLDVQQVLGGAPGAHVTLVDIPNLSDFNIIGGYFYIVERKKDDNSTYYSLVNSSFSGCEAQFLPAYGGGPDTLALYEEIFKQGNAEGITFVASSNDEGGMACPDVSYFDPSSPLVARFTPGVGYPASSPHVTAVGGGNLLTTKGADLSSTYAGENGLGDPEIPHDPYGTGKPATGGYWGAGGGLSQLFTRPSYQALVATGTTSVRTLPDVGMHVGGCPGGISFQPCGPNRSAVLVYVGGALGGVIGTSVSSPEFVGALALYVQKNGPQGNINPYLYAQAAAQNAGGKVVYNRNIPSFDGKYTDKSASPVYSYIVGNGTPRVRQLLGLSDLPAAGTPQTATNP